MLTSRELADKVSDLLREHRIDVDKMNYFQLADFVKSLLGNMRRKPVAMTVVDFIDNPVIQDSPDHLLVIHGKDHGYIAVTAKSIKVIDVTQNGIYEGDPIDYLPYDPSDPRNDDDGMDIFGGKKAILIDNTGGGGGE